MTMKTLSIGAGKSPRREGLVTLDISQEANPDVVWDLNQFPYPFEDNSFDEIDCFDVIEHVDNIPKVMEECCRILKNNGVMKITTPHFSSPNSYTDPTHKFHLGMFSFDCFSHTHEYSYYSKARFEISKRQLMFKGIFPIKNILTKLANKFPRIYEEKWAWIFPAWFMFFELKAKK